MGKTATPFIPGLGISEFRVFVGATLTGAIAEVACFGPNTQANAGMGNPGIFPIQFEGNCVFATQPLFQCKDDGEDDSVMETELDVKSEIEDDSKSEDGD